MVWWTSSSNSMGQCSPHLISFSLENTASLHFTGSPLSSQYRHKSKSGAKSPHCTKKGRTEQTEKQSQHHSSPVADILRKCLGEKQSYFRNPLMKTLSEFVQNLEQILGSKTNFAFSNQSTWEQCFFTFPHPSSALTLTRALSARTGWGYFSRLSWLSTREEEEVGQPAWVLLASSCAAPLLGELGEGTGNKFRCYSLSALFCPEYIN